MQGDGLLRFVALPRVEKLGLGLTQRKQRERERERERKRHLSEAFRRARDDMVSYP